MLLCFTSGVFGIGIGFDILFLQNVVGVSPDNRPIPTFSTSLHPLSGIVPSLVQLFCENKLDNTPLVS
jgi:hypothetical protein